MLKKLLVTYSQHYKDNAQGHIYLHKNGPCTITLTGASSMSQEELNFYGEKIAKALSKIDREEVDKFNVFQSKMSK